MTVVQLVFLKLQSSRLRLVLFERQFSYHFITLHHYHQQQQQHRTVIFDNAARGQNKQEAQLSLGWADCTAHIRKPVSVFGRERKRFHRVTTVTYTLW